MTVRVPSPEIMFESLCLALRLEKSVFVPQDRDRNGMLKEGTGRMTKDLSLDVQAPGDGMLRIQVATHSGVGTGEGHILYSCGRREFAEKVWAIEAGIECARALGVDVGDL